MANERTFLAWIRTSIGIMAFGFVVERFALFLRQLRFILTPTPDGKILLQPGKPAPGTFSSVFGIVLVGIGALMGVLAFFRYKKVEKQIDEDTYEPSILLDLLMEICVIAIGIFLIFYLIHSLET